VEALYSRVSLGGELSIYKFFGTNGLFSPYFEKKIRDLNEKNSDQLWFGLEGSDQGSCSSKRASKGSKDTVSKKWLAPMAIHFRSVNGNDNTRVPPLIVVGFYRSSNGTYRLGYLELLYTNGDFVVKKSKQSLSSYLAKSNPMIKIEHKLPLRIESPTESFEVTLADIETALCNYSRIPSQKGKQTSKHSNNY